MLAAADVNISRATPKPTRLHRIKLAVNPLKWSAVDQEGFPSIQLMY